MIRLMQPIQPTRTDHPTTLASLKRQPSALNATDHLQFGQSRGERLLQKYGIDPAQVRIETSGPALNADKKDVLIRLLEAHEHALKNKALGNYSGRQFSTHMQTANGQWTLGTNIELTRDNVFCGERAALVNSWNRALEKLSLKALADPAKLAEAQNGLLVKTLAMSSGMALTSPTAGSPCSECQSWLATQRYVGPDTQIVNLRQDESSGEFFINLRTVRDLMPLNETITPSLSDKALADLPINISPRARKSMTRFRMDEGYVRALVQQAKNAYIDNRTSTMSGKNTGAAVRISNGSNIAGQRLDWTARWFGDSDLNAAIKGLQASPSNRVHAVAYYGEDTLPTVKNLGILAQETWGGSDTLMIVVENDRLEVRTIDDYMSDIYISPSTHSRRP